MAQSPKAIVIDNGSWKCRAGFGGEQDPSAVLRSVVGKSQQITLIGETALKSRDADLVSPVERGLITDFDKMEALWGHLFENELKVDPKKHPVLLADTPLNPQKERETSAQIMFEKFGVPSYYPVYQAVLALYATGHQTGVVVDSGHGVTRVVPMNGGYAVKEAIQQINLGGKEVTEELEKLLKEAGKPCQDATGANISRDIKEKVAFVAQDFDKQCKEGTVTEYKLPDGKNIKLGSEVFTCTELLFDPSRAGCGGDGIHKLVNSAILECPESVRPSLYSCIGTCGGNSLISGFSDRLKKEMTALAPTGSVVKVVSRPEREFAVWGGGSLFTSFIGNMWITKQEYEEHGVSIVSKKAI